jgi:hypothetical protein
MSEQRTAQPRSLAFGAARSRADKGHKSPPRVVSCANLADLSRALASRFVTSGGFVLAAFFPRLDVAARSYTPSGVRWPATVLRRRVLFSRGHAQSPPSQSGPQPDGSLCKLCAPWPDVQLGLAAAAGGRWRRGSLQQSGRVLAVPCHWHPPPGPGQPSSWDDGTRLRVGGRSHCEPRAQAQARARPMAGSSSPSRRRTCEVQDHEHGSFLRLGGIVSLNPTQATSQVLGTALHLRHWQWHETRSLKLSSSSLGSAK